MAKIPWKGSTLLAPVPLALVTCTDGTRSNIITVAWTGIINSNPPKTYISLRPERFSHDIIKKSGFFVINLTTRKLIRAADFCGVKSGRDIDKFSELGLQFDPSLNFGCPMLCDSPLSLECRVFETVSLGSHDMFMADIVSVNADETFMDTNGKLRLDKAELTAYSHGTYYALGAALGTFGFTVKKKKPLKRKPRK